MTTARLVRGIGALLATSIALAAIAAGSATPVPFHPGDAGRLRLSWSARPERIEVCRTLSDEELERVAEHMRRRVECVGQFASYELVVLVDGRPVATSVVRGAGLRHDRPIYLLREFEIPRGAHRLGVRFSRRETVARDTAAASDSLSALPYDADDTGIYVGRAEREAVERTRRGRAAIPPRLALDTTLTIGPRRVIVVTLNHERRVLEVLGR